VFISTLSGIKETTLLNLFSKQKHANEERNNILGHYLLAMKKPSVKVLEFYIRIHL
jgi:hypothetical protein